MGNEAQGNSHLAQIGNEQRFITCDKTLGVETLMQLNAVLRTRWYDICLQLSAQDCRADLQVSAVVGLGF
jgi:hypothetical protein